MKNILYCILYFLSIMNSDNAYSQINKKSLQIKELKCSTFVYNLSLDEMKIRDICVNVTKGDYINLNDFSTSPRKENESWRFEIEIRDNKTMSLKNYKAAFYIYENSSEIIQYHPVVENDEFKAIIYNKNKYSWNVLLFQNDEYKMLSTYLGYQYTNAFGIRSKTKSNINY